MSAGDVKARAEAIEGFAATLADLRASVGTPSFRLMAGRSRIISHTTLHEAAQGNRLPSWETTVEFVKACGADPADYRDRWESADAAVAAHGHHRPRPAHAASDPPAESARRYVRRSAPGALQAANRVAEGPRRLVVNVPVEAGPLVDAVPATLAEGDHDPTRPEPTEGVGLPGPDVRATWSPSGPPRRRGRTYALVGGAVAGAAVLAVVASLAWSASGSDEPGPSVSAAPVAADCPMVQPNPPPALPEHDGDAAAFVADVTMPDCSHVRRGETATKIWRLKNVGTVAWVGYSLRRVDLPQGRDQCQTISDIAVPPTQPGELVTIEAAVTVPNAPGFCFVRFKMMDAAAKVAFPGNRPVNFQVIVD